MPDTTAQIARINELSATARTSWLALLAFLAYIGITLLAVQDADFFVRSRQTELPLVGISIPTFSFFIFAPPLAAALYIYLHIHLLKLWDALADAPETVGGEPLGESLHPWIANDYALSLRRDRSLRPRPLRPLGNLASLALVWGAGPLVLAGFWWRSATARDELLTFAIALSFFLALRAGLLSLWHARARLRRRGYGDPWDGLWKRPLLWLLALLVIATSWLRTEAGFDYWANGIIDLYFAATGHKPFRPGAYPNFDARGAQSIQEQWVASRWWIPDLATFTYDNSTFPFSLWLEVGEDWTPLAPIDLAYDVLVPLPPDWRSPETARLAFRQSWCAREGLDMNICDHIDTTDRPLPTHVEAQRRAWCDRAGEGEAAGPYAGEACPAFFR